jgi:hypothetical protein
VSFVRFSCAASAKPSQAFTDAEKKQVLRSIHHQRWKTIWLIDQVSMQMDDLMQTGTNLAFPKDLNLNDMFAIRNRIKPDLIKCCLLLNFFSVWK